MGATDSCCPAPPIATASQTQYTNADGQYAQPVYTNANAPYVQAPMQGNNQGNSQMYNDIEQQLLIEREKIKRFTKNEKIYKANIQKLTEKNQQLSEKEKAIKLKLKRKKSEINMLLNDKNELMKSSEEYKVKNDELTEKVTIYTEKESEVLKEQSKEANKPKQLREMAPDTMWQDYDVKFKGDSLGLLLSALKDAKSCIVQKCLTHFAIQNVNVGSLVIEVNGANAMGLEYELIRNMLIQNLQNSTSDKPLVVTFRSKLDGSRYKQINNINERGLLHLTVVRCMQLKHAARYVQICVGDATLTTDKIEKDENPEWDEAINFKNYRCAHGKKAIITVFGQASVLGKKEIGSLEYDLPVVFNKMKNETLELTNDKGNLKGVIVLKCVLIPRK